MERSAVSRGLLKIIEDLEPEGFVLWSHRAPAARAQSTVARIARFRSPGIYRKALQPFPTGDTPVLEDLGVGRVRFRNHYLRLWCLLQHSRAINLLPALRDPAYYRELLPSEVRLMLPP